MNNNDPYQIDRYLMNQLSLDETAAFEDEMSKDLNLANEVEKQRKLIESLQIAGKLESLSQITAITKNWKDFVPELAKLKTNNFETLAKATDEKIDQLIQLAFQFFKPYSVSFRKHSVENQNEKERAYEFYAKKNYEEALPLLKNLSNKNVETRLMLGNALLATDKPELAYQKFETIINEQPLGFVNDAHWYAGLAALFLNNTQQAMQHFQFVIDDEHAGKKLKTKATNLISHLKLTK